jgi:hypothetical protein
LFVFSEDAQHAEGDDDALGKNETKWRRQVLAMEACATESEAFQEVDASDSVTRLSCVFCLLTMER